jgi:cytochrome c-type protein NapB
MKISRFAMLLLAIAFAAAPIGAMAQDKAKGKDKNTPIEAQSEADSLRFEKDRPPIARDFVQQPPLIPHSTKGYNITKNFNKCMDCHAWSRYEQTGATKVSITHFKDREGRESANISPRRYFCTTCHVPQMDAKPLVENTFKRAEGLR